MDNSKQQLRRQWWITGTLGTLLLGSGLCVLLESSHLKHDGAQLYTWLLTGTIALAFVIAGVVMLIKAGVIEDNIKKL